MGKVEREGFGEKIIWQITPSGPVNTDHQQKSRTLAAFPWVRHLGVEGFSGRTKGRWSRFDRDDGKGESAPHKGGVGSGEMGVLSSAPN